MYPSLTVFLSYGAKYGVVCDRHRPDIGWKVADDEDAAETGSTQRCVMIPRCYDLDTIYLHVLYNS